MAKKESRIKNYSQGAWEALTEDELAELNEELGETSLADFKKQISKLFPAPVKMPIGRIKK